MNYGSFCGAKNNYILYGTIRIYPTNAVRIRRDPKSDIVPYSHRTAVGNIEP